MQWRVVITVLIDIVCSKETVLYVDRNIVTFIDARSDWIFLRRKSNYKTVLRFGQYSSRVKGDKSRTVARYVVRRCFIRRRSWSKRCAHRIFTRFLVADLSAEFYHCVWNSKVLSILKRMSYWECDQVRRIVQKCGPVETYGKSL